MRNRVRVFSALMLGFVPFANAGEVIKDKPHIRTVTELNRSEGHTINLVLDGHLFVGKSQTEGPVERPQRKGITPLAAKNFPETFYNRLEIYPYLDGGAPKLVEIKHSLNFIHPLDDKTVMVVGKSQGPWKTHYTKVWREGGEFKTAMSTFDGGLTDEEQRIEDEREEGDNTEIQIDYFAGDRDQKFFTEIGQEKSSVFIRAGADLERTLPSNLILLTNAIRAPASLARSGDYLLVIELNNILNSFDDELVRLNWKTKEIGPTKGSQKSQALHETLALPGGLVAVTETLGGRVLMVDVEKNEVKDAVEVGGEPRGLTRWGHCVVVASQMTKQLSFLDFKKAGSPLVAIWDLTGAGKTLSRPSSVAMTPMGIAFVRSNYECPGCFPSMNSVVEVKASSPKTFKACH